MSHRFIIGIGSQRAGSTLLHRLIGDCIEVFMHPVKELHYFDTLFGSRPQKALADFSRRQLSREMDRIMAAKDYGFMSRRYKSFLRANSILATTAISDVDYLDLFRPCLRKYSVLGEVTPEYMLFDEEQVARMRGMVGEDATIIMLCRDPVQRLFSAAKLYNIYNALRMNRLQLDAWLRRNLAEKTTWMLAQDSYNDYERAIRIYRSVFPRFLALSYEQLVTEPESVLPLLREACNVTIDAVQFRTGLSKVSNRLEEVEPPDAELVTQVTERYATQIAFLSDFFPHYKSRALAPCSDT